jgi:hypothetical protein
MRGTSESIAEYLSDIATLLERYGVSLRFATRSDDLELLEDQSGNLSFELLGSLPDDATPARSEIAIREAFEPIGPDRNERTEYEYELVDRERDYRRAFHLRFPDWFRARYLVLVHEHCERPIGRIACDHYEGSPLKDGFAGILALVDVWTAEPPACAELRCLERVGADR